MTHAVETKKQKNVWIVSWYNYGEPPVVTAFDNQKAAEKYRDYESCQDHEKVCLDECPVYSSFTDYDQ